MERESSQREPQQPLVSVIIPVYKVASYLDACVASVTAQTYRNLEILLVDDGSPDECPAMCDAWAERDPRVRVIHKPNGGLSDARNAGIARATGDYIYFADSDDTVAPNLVEDCLTAMRKYDADLVMFKFDTISESGKPLLSDYRHNDFDQVQVLEPVEAVKMQVRAEIDGYFWAFLAPASTYQGSGFSFPVGRKIEDLARICEVIGAATRVVRIPEALYHYRLREGSITAGLDPRLIRDWMKAADDRETYIDERFPELRRFMKLQQLNFFANLDYETMRQSLIAGLKIDPEDADALRRRIESLRDEIERDDEITIPAALHELLGILKLAVAKGMDGLVPDAPASAAVPVVGETAGNGAGSAGAEDAAAAGTGTGAGEGARAGDGEHVSLSDLFRDMREDWRQMRIQWAGQWSDAVGAVHDAVPDVVRNAMQEAELEQVEQRRE
ncbi:glycosyltransferase [Bifidobacterium sp. MA2]|uniref:Glycosyltransferase n=1 Tax=Bifidobacterium santillanense TaxID=2809028 RepID=A0ABS5UNV0_9BIFI|nr:glycosyltransferase family 2 protein [Bifidobacterium santillanense]MBT1172586.1 glycosyltransferase [Bifidobacterium santillanense]